MLRSLIRRPGTVLAGVIVLLAALLTIASPAPAQPIYNHFTAADLSQTDTGCHIRNKVWCSVPDVTANSYFNATMISGRNFWHYPGIWQYDVGPSAGQQIGVMCWLSGGAAGGIWEKVDARLTINNGGGMDPWIHFGSWLWIGYVNDADVNLSYADRVNYVPQCSSTRPPAPVRAPRRT